MQQMGLWSSLASLVSVAKLIVVQASSLHPFPKTRAAQAGSLHHNKAQSWTSRVSRQKLD